MPNMVFYFNCSSSDMWGLGCLLWEAFNGPLKERNSLKEVENVSTIAILLNFSNVSNVS